MPDGVVVAGLVAIAVALLFGRLSALERRLSRLSRLEAKVDALLKHAGVSFDPVRQLPPDVREALQRGETILAIKPLRQATGAGLKDAKEVVDEARRRVGMSG